MTLQKVCHRGLLISTFVFLVLCAAQGWSGNWATFYFVWSGSGNSAGFLQFVMDLAGYHVKMGYAIGAVSIIIVIFAFLGKTNRWVRLFAVLGLIVTAVAAVGGYLYVHSAFIDRLALGQMADAFIGALAAYFLMLLFMYKTPGLHLLRKKNP